MQRFFSIIGGLYLVREKIPAFRKRILAKFLYQGNYYLNFKKFFFFLGLPGWIFPSNPRQL